MNRNQLINALSEKTGLDKKDVRRTIDEMQRLIIQEAKEGQRICLHGFGSFKPRLQTSRPARNPRNGTTVQLSPRTIIHFKCAPLLLEQMNNK
ncbi:MAG: HU family DNA-binding protein [Parabacteroides sp.]|uniref:HU family DNA-binding protein n=1 Tax=uncultured Parabacteroides sp. TaxID=512312 RepID=UPI0025E66DF3|nr:HU family DNA-binding protein [uncultured Parabacteroides sp.]MCD7849353.1 HU family DNA-binding protein [Parabacteroides sp.]